MKKAKHFKPDLLAFSFVTNQFQDIKQIGKRLKKELNVPVIVGGTHPTILPEEVIKEDWIDMLCIGEGEEALLELADKLGKNEDISEIQNLWIKKNNGEIIKNTVRPLWQELDKLPFPDYELFNKYGLINNRIDIITGRGCINSCTFCINSFKKSFYKGQTHLRRRSVDNVMEEILYVDKKYNPKQYRFLDDTFAYDIDWLRDFSEKYSKKIGKPYRCTLSPNVTTYEIVQELKKSNCKVVEMGFQTASNELRSKMMHRHYSNEKILEICGWLKQNKIKLSLDLIFGTPGETPSDMWETLHFCDKIDITYTTPSFLYPFPKTKILEYALNDGYVDDELYKKICDGVGSHHTTFLLNHPYKEDVMKFQAVISIYNKSFRIFKPFLRRTLKWKYGRTHRFLHFLSVPFNDWYEFRRRVSMMPKMVMRTKKELKKSVTYS